MSKSKDEIIYYLSKCLIDFIDINYFEIDRNSKFSVQNSYMKCPTNKPFKQAINTLIKLKVIKKEIPLPKGGYNAEWSDYKIDWEALEALEEVVDE